MCIFQTAESESEREKLFKIEENFVKNNVKKGIAHDAAIQKANDHKHNQGSEKMRAKFQF